MTGQLFLVRHAQAGTRSEWDGDDQLRPLTHSGRAQALALAARLREMATGMLVSSPYVRCLQTVEPLAALVGTDVQADPRLAEDTGSLGALQLLEELPDGSVLCTHGDVIPDTIAALQRRGCTFHGAPDWRKATVWVLQRADDRSFTAGEVWPPP